MISVIVCSAHPPEWSVHEHHVAETIGTSFEYIRILNPGKKKGLCAAYNTGVKKAQGDLCVFLHEDVFVVTPHWGKILEEKFQRQKKLGLLGVAGSSYLFESNPLWVAPGRPFIHGKVIHDIAVQNSFILTVFSKTEHDMPVVAVDGLFMAIRGDLFSSISFDEVVFDDFHFYDIDICMQVGNTHNLLVTHDLLVKHMSGGGFDDCWVQYAGKFIEKYRKILPRSCVSAIPDKNRIIPFESLDMKNVVSPEEYHFIKQLGKIQSL